MKNSVKLGLIGAGGRLRGIVRRLLEHEPRIRVAAACDPFEASHTSLHKMLGYDYTRAADVDALVNDPEVEAVFIGSWNALHAQHAIAALDAGKDVFCEKPLATTLEDSLAIAEAVKRSGKRFIFGLVLRYSPHYRKLHEIIRDGAIGKLISFEFNETLGFNHGGYVFGNWRRKRANGGTHVLEKCCHDIDIANWMVGALPVRAASFGGCDVFKPENAHFADRIGKSKEGYEAYRSWPDPQRVDPFNGDNDVFDNQVAILEYANGVRATFHTNSHCAITERRMYLCGTEGTIRADLVTGRIELQRIGWETEIECVPTGVEGGHGGGDEVMTEALAETLINGSAPLTSITEGLHSAIAVFGIDQSVDENRMVDLRPLWERAGIDPSRI